MSIFKWRRLRIVAPAAIVGAAVIAAVAYATVPDSNGLIHTCYHVNNHGQVNGNSDLRVIDPSSPVRAGQACASDEAPLTLSQTNAYSVHTTSNVSMSSDPSTFTTVAALSVPSGGSYWFLGTVYMDLTTTNSFDITETCEVVFHAGALSDTAVGFVRVNHDTPGEATIQTLESFPAAGTATLQCLGPNAFAFNARLTAVTLTGFTDTAS